jgi:hypothetical protein
MRTLTRSIAMPIEPGFLPAAKVVLANLAAVGVLAAYLPSLIKQPILLLRTLAAAVFFSIDRAPVRLIVDLPARA